MKKTLILGASPNQKRYSYMAAERLVHFGHPIINVGMNTGIVAGVPIEKPGTFYSDVDTLTLYVGVANQPLLYDYILLINPRRIIFNPGTTNEDLQIIANASGILTEHACTLVLLALGQY